MSSGTMIGKRPEPGIFMIDFRSMGWWYWLMSAGLLTAAACGWSMGYLLVIALTVFQLLHFIIRTRSVRSFAVQVRLGYLLLLLLAVPQATRLIFWIPTMGTWVMVLFGYCAMARTISLLPWNRVRPLSTGLLRQTFLSAPVKGSFLQERYADCLRQTPGDAPNCRLNARLNAASES